MCETKIQGQVLTWARGKNSVSRTQIKSVECVKGLIKQIVQYYYI